MPLREPRPWHFCLVLIFGLIPTLGRAQTLGSGDHHLSVMAGASTRPYFLHVPPADSPHPMPIVIMLHGAGGFGEHAARDYGWIEKSDAEHFIAVFPQGLAFRPARPPSFFTNPNVWNDHRNIERDTRRGVDDISYLTAVLDDVQRNCNADSKRIYITGFSNGASMTFYLASQISSRIAAIAPVSGECFIHEAKLAHPIPLMLIAGDADPLNPLNGGPAKNPWGQPYTKPPMIDSVTDWLTFNDESTTDFTTESGDGFTTKTYAGKTKCPVIFTVITNQGHEWPGHHRVLPRAITGNNSATFDATAVIWDFFKSKSLDN